MTIERINALIKASQMWSMKVEYPKYGHGFCWVGIFSITETHIYLTCKYYDDLYDEVVSIADLDQILLDKITF